MLKLENTDLHVVEVQHACTILLHSKSLHVYRSIIHVYIHITYYSEFHTEDGVPQNFPTQSLRFPLQAMLHVALPYYIIASHANSIRSTSQVITENHHPDETLVLTLITH